ncbi:MAG: DUF2975 domain-containing protein [Henriciella sp.]|uniref:DUF2975 domain-containing protein n=1 Tax=Henriciella sp. TaxID=1968823 RepID=UPI003C759D8E
MADDNRTPPRAQSDKEKSYETLSILAWVAVGILALNVTYFIGDEVGGIVFESPGDWIDILKGFMVGLLKAGPTILIAFALTDFAGFFHRCGQGDTFTERNVKTLKSGAESLIWAAFVSGIIAPTILDAVDEPGAHEILDFTDLALGVGLMGIALYGFASVLKDAVAIKAENDEFV